MKLWWASFISWKQGKISDAAVLDTLLLRNYQWSFPSAGHLVLLLIHLPNLPEQAFMTAPLDVASSLSDLYSLYLLSGSMLFWSPLSTTTKIKPLIQLKSTSLRMLCLKHPGFPDWLWPWRAPALLWAPEVPAGWASFQPILVCCLGLEDLPTPEYLLPIFPYCWSCIWKPKFSNRISVIHLHVKMSPKDFINWHVIILSDRENNTEKLNPKFLDSSFVKSENPIFLKFQFLFYLLSK